MNTSYIDTQHTKVLAKIYRRLKLPSLFVDIQLEGDKNPNTSAYPNEKLSLYTTGPERVGSGTALLSQWLSSVPACLCFGK